MNKNLTEQIIMEAFKGDGFHSLPVYDVQRGKLWDTLIHPGEKLPQRLYLFDKQLSTTHPFQITNMLTPKRLAAPQRFAIETINFMFIDTSMETELAFSDSVVFDFRHGSKWYAKSLLSMLEIGSYAELDVLRRCTYCERVHVHMSCPGCGSSNFSVLSTSKEQPLTSHRTKRTVYTHRMIAPHVISYDMDFGIEFNHSLNELKLPPFTLKCWFEGLHARAVQ